MEYKYHPVFKHITYFIISYMFLRHQKLMNNELLLVNAIILTLFLIILDHLFISGHITPFEPLTYEYINEKELKKLEKEIKKEKKKEKKLKKKNKKKNIDSIENTVELQNYHDNNIMNELNHIQLNHPNNLKCQNHSQFVRMENSLDNFINDDFNNNTVEDYPEYMAYNE
jgi:hypothetical protein